MRTGYDLREGAQILSDRFARDSAEVQTAPLPFPKDGVEPWSELTAALPSAEHSFSSDFFVACAIWTVLLALVTWAYFGAQWIGLL